MNEITVVDANLIFSILISDSEKIWRGFARKDITFVTPNFVIVELFQHFDRIKKASHLPEEKMFSIMSRIVARLQFHGEGLISTGSLVEAYRLCREVDPKDVLYVALALELDAKFWTNDQTLKTGLIKKGFDNFYES